MTEAVIPDTASALADYDAWVATHPGAARDLQERIIDLLDDAGLTFDRVSVRIKSRDSFLSKLRNPDYPDYRDLDSAYDLIGVRVIAFHSSEIPQLKKALGDEFTIVTEVDKAAETARRGGFGYASQHLVVRDSRCAEAPDAAADTPAADSRLIEIQLRTVLQHAWAEFEHDIRYKNPRGVDPDIQRAFTLAAGLIELADQQFDQIAEKLGQACAGESTEQEFAPAHRIDAAGLPQEIIDIAGPEFPMSKVAYYDYAVAMLAAHGIVTDADLRALLTPANINALQQAMDYNFPPGQVRLIDDMLLYVYGDTHISRTQHIGDNPASRPARLSARWVQLTS